MAYYTKPDSSAGFSAVIQVDEATKGLMEDIQRGITSEITLPSQQISGKIDELTAAIESIGRNSKNAAEDANEAKKEARSILNKADDLDSQITMLKAELTALGNEQKEIRTLLNGNMEKLDSLIDMVNKLARRQRNFR